MAAQRKPLKHLFPCYFDYLLYFYGDNLFFVRKYLTQSSSLFCLFCSKLTAEVHRERGNKIKYICTLIKLHKQVLFIRNKINRSVGKKNHILFLFAKDQMVYLLCNFAYISIFNYASAFNHQNAQQSPFCSQPWDSTAKCFRDRCF